MTADQIRSLQPALAALLLRFRGCFQTERTFGHWQRYLLGLMADLKRKSIEPIALAAGVAVRTLQEFLAFFAWDHERVDQQLQRLVMDEHGCEAGIGVLDASGHVKQGNKTPGVQHQWCGEVGKQANCVMGQHLLYTDNDLQNPFTCMLASDLYLPKVWAEDRERCRAAKIPDDLGYRAKWRIGVDQVESAIGNGVRFAWMTFDEDYGKIPEFWFEMDRLGQRSIGEVPSNFFCWPTWPRWRSPQAAHASKRADNVCRFSPVFRDQQWKRFHIKDTTRGPMIWEVKAAQVHLVDSSTKPSRPTDRQYWLIVARNVDTKEYKYFASNASKKTRLDEMLRAAFARWHVEKWFERAKQETGFGAFEVRTYQSLIRHWLCSRMAMYFLAEQTERLRGEKSADHAGASGGGCERLGEQDLESVLAFVG
ncbi:MAG TPA: IS701 family transposase [Phycisphaerae bacterium]|nr:IS701 family transposase [Phycisphaerae bacterium]